MPLYYYEVHLKIKLTVFGQKGVNIWGQHVEKAAPLHNWNDFRVNVIYMQLANYKLH